MEDPYADAPPKCILCKYNVDLDHKVCVTITSKLTHLINSQGLIVFGVLQTVKVCLAQHDLCEANLQFQLVIIV